MIKPNQIGALLCMQAYLGVLIIPLVAGFADIYQKHRLVMLTTAVGQAILQICLLVPQLGFYGIAAVLFVQSFFQNIIPTIMDASTIAAVGSQYGSIRLWGSIGFGVLAFAAGGLESLSGNPKLRR